VSGDGDDTARGVLLEETRRQLDRQVAEVEHIDEKATRTVRYVILGLAALGTLFSFGPNSPAPNLLVKLGAGALTVAALFGLFTYSTSRMYVAEPTALGSDLGDLTVEELLDEILGELATHTNDNEEMIAGDAFFLTLTRVFFALGGVLVGMGLLTL